MAIEIDRRGVSHATRRGVARGVSPDRGIAIAIGRVGVIGCPNPLRRAGEGGISPITTRASTRTKPLEWSGFAGGDGRGRRVAGGVRVCANSTAQYTGGHARARRVPAGWATMGGWAGVARGRARISITRFLKRACIRHDSARRCDLDAACCANLDL